MHGHMDLSEMRELENVDLMFAHNHDGLNGCDDFDEVCVVCVCACACVCVCERETGYLAVWWERSGRNAILISHVSGYHTNKERKKKEKKRKRGWRKERKTRRVLIFTSHVRMGRVTSVTPDESWNRHSGYAAPTKPSTIRRYKFSRFTCVVMSCRTTRQDYTCRVVE